MKNPVYHYQTNKIPCRCIFILSFILLIGCTKASEEKAILLFKGGSIYTLVEKNPRVEVIAIRDSVIIFSGKEDAAKGLIGSETVIVDLKGKTLTPGWIEGHGHFMGLGYSELNLDLTDTKSYDEIVEKVKIAASRTQSGSWIIGRGWHQSKWISQPDEIINGFPLHHALSEVSPENPVVLYHASGHASFANAKAMEIAGIGPLDQEMGGKRETPGGEIIRDNNGNPTGIFNENAMGLINKHIPEKSEENDP